MINGCKIGHLIPVVTTYSFDRETPVKLFESDKEAEEYLRKMYEEELPDRPRRKTVMIPRE